GTHPEKDTPPLPRVESRKLRATNQKSKIKNLKSKMSLITTAAVALPLIIASILYPPLELLFVAIAVAAISIALYEFWFLARRVGAKPDVVVGYAATAALLVAFFFNWLELLFVIVPLFIIAALAAEMLRGAPFDKMILSVGASVLGVLYV